MASALLRYSAARRAKFPFPTGASHSAAACPQHAAASLSSADERGPAPPKSHTAHPGPQPAFGWTHRSAPSLPWPLPTPPSPPDSAPWPRGTAARPPPSVPRVGKLVAEVEIRRGVVGPQGDGLAVGPGCSAAILPRGVPDTLSHQPQVLVARLRGAPGLTLRELAIPLPPRPTTLLPLLPLLPQLLVEHPVQLPRARVRRAVDVAEVRRRQLLIAAHITDGVLLIAAHITDGVLLSLVVHI
eukprot:scaffold50058_cov60-Phaeocystis_antarctica.AAC.4